MTSTLREKQRELTTDLIIDAVAEVIVEQGVRAFSMDDVASRAGISLRTLYRYYPGREELLSAVTDRLADVLGVEIESQFSTLEAGIEAIRGRFALFSEHDMLSRATVALVAAAEGISAEREDSRILAKFAEERAARTAAIRALVREELPDLPQPLLDQVFAVTRVLGSMPTWAQLTGPAAGLDSDAAAVSVQWALKTLLDRARELEERGVRSLEEDL